MDINQKVLNSMERIVNVRGYENKPIEDELIKKLLTAFSMGPSLANIQPWELVVLRTEEDKQKAVLASLDPFLSINSHGAQQWIQAVPFVMVACIEERRALARIGEEGHIFSIQDLFTALQNFRLLASINDIGSSVVREFDKAKLKELLSLPWYVEPQAIITAGYSKAQLEMPPRFQVRDIIHGGEWDEKG
jgi:5,6-dimethylbenzimidazole synthase